MSRLGATWADPCGVWKGIGGVLRSSLYERCGAYGCIAFGDRRLGQR
jgi:hypothetical protein